MDSNETFLANKFNYSFISIALDYKTSGTSFKSSLKLLDCLKDSLNIKRIKTYCKTNNGFVFNEVAREEGHQEINNLTGSITTV